MDTYYKPEDLPKFAEIGEEAPELAKKYFDWYGAVFAEGELTEREKALIALAVAHAVQCPYCIDSYTQQALEQGLTMKHLGEAMHAAASLRAGIALAHALPAHNINKKVSM